MKMLINKIQHELHNMFEYYISSKNVGIQLVEIR